MAALTYHLVVDQGADYVRSIPVFEGNSPITIDAWQVSGQIRKRAGDAVLLHELDLEPDGVNVILRIPAAASSAWTFHTAQYDVELVSPDGLTTSRLLEGVVIVRPETTR